MGGNRDDLFFPRSAILLAFFGVWSLVAVVRAFYLAGPGRERFIEIGEKIAAYEGVLPAPRGRILDRGGVPLAWSERYFDLQQVSGVSSVDRERLRAVLPQVEVPAFRGEKTVLKRGLSPDEILALEPVVKGSGAFRIVSRSERLTVSSVGIRRLLGGVELRDGVQVGISGLEADYNAALTGHSGRFRVLLDRYRNWIGSSWTLLERPVPGRDIQLDRTAEMLDRVGREVVP